MKLLFCFFLVSPLFACTEFLLKDRNGQCVVGRSMEFGLDLRSEVIIVPRGWNQISRPEGKLGLSWTTRFAYIGLTALGQNWVVDGVNEEGLTVAGLWFPGTVYPEVDLEISNRVVALQDVGDWILAACGNIDEVKEALPMIEIWPEKLPVMNEIPPLHFSIHDRQGRSLAVEFIEGQMQIKDNPVGVLTNAPSLDWHLTNLENYINLSAVQKTSVSFDGTVLHPRGQGFGMLGLPGDWSPPSRFVRISSIKNVAIPAKTSPENCNLAFHLLNTVDIPYGVVRSANPEHYDYTQWTVVKDLESATLYYRTYETLKIVPIGLHEELTRTRTEPRKLSITGAGHL